jgi:hypothetical protein
MILFSLTKGNKKMNKVKFTKQVENKFVKTIDTFLKKKIVKFVQNNYN